MKRRNAAWIGFIAFVILASFPGIITAQGPKMNIIVPDRIFITYSKTTSLVFPYAIKSVDRGSRDILAQKATGAENILQLKAAQEGFAETNLTVITADGNLYAYVVNYSDNPASLTISIEPGLSYRPLAVFSEGGTNNITGGTAEAINVKQAVIKGPREREYGISMAVQGIYLHEDMLYFQLKLKNNTAISYDVQQLRIFIRDRKKSKRTASQELEMQPFYIAGPAKRISANAEQNVTISLPKFTIPNKKYLVVQLMEQNGGRHLNLKIANRRLVKSGRLLSNQ